MPRRSTNPPLRRTAGALGVALSALQEAIKTGRVTVAADGRVPDLEKCRAEWLANTRSEHGPAPLADREHAAGKVALAPVEGESRAEALRRLAIAKANSAEDELRRSRGELVLASEVEQEWADVLSSARTELLGVPTRARQEIPELGARGFELLAALIRDVLERLSEGETQPKQHNERKHR